MLGFSELTPLGVSGTFTETNWTDAGSLGNQVNATLVVDQVSTTNGVVWQWSDDASAVATSQTYTSIIGANNYALPIIKRYFRLFYTNSTTAQTYFQYSASVSSSATSAPSSTQGSPTTGQLGTMVQGAVTTGTPTYITGQTSPLSLDTAGNLRTSTSIAANSSVNVNQIAGTATSVNNGAVDAGTQRVTIASDSTGNLGVGQGSTTSGEIGPLIQGAVTTGAPTYTTGQTSPLSLDTTGNLRTTASIAANSSVNVNQVAGSAVSTVATGVQEVGISDSTGNSFLSAANALNSTGTGLLASQIIAQFDDTTPTTITENQFGNMRMSANRNLYSTIRDAAGNERGANINASNQLTTVDASTVAQGSTTSGQLGNLGQGAVTTAAPSYTTAQTSPLSLTTAGGLRTDTSSIAGVATSTGNGVSGTGVQRVTIASDSTGNIATIGTSVTPGTAATNLGKAEDAAHTTADVGVFALGVRNDANTTVTSTAGDYSQISVDLAGNARVVGNIDTDTADAGSPVKIGGQARTTNPTAVANADRVNAMFDKVGKFVIKTDAPRELVNRNNITLTSTTETTLVAAGGAGVFNDLTTLIITNTNTTTGVRVDIRDATAGTVRFSVAIAPNGGAVIPFSVPVPQTTAANNWTAQLSAAVTDIRIFAVTAQSN
jgi:hypothetical protein